MHTPPPFGVGLTLQGTTMHKCRLCDDPICDDRNLCPDCAEMIVVNDKGEVLMKICPDCGTEIPDDWDRCDDCGHEKRVLDEIERREDDGPTCGSCGGELDPEDTDGDLCWACEPTEVDDDE